MPNNETDKIERLAANMARGKLKPQWVLKLEHPNSGATSRVVDKPVLGDLGLVALKAWLPKIGICFDAEFDTTGRRVE